MLLIKSINTYSQNLFFESGYWMPKPYINGIENKIPIKRIENYLKPVSAILIRDNKIFIKTYKDEFKQSGVKNINRKEIYLRSVMVPLAVNGVIMADQVLNRYASDQYYLYRTKKNSMFLIIKDKLNHADTIQFTKYIVHTPIISDDVVLAQIKLADKFDLFSSNSNELEKNIFIKTDGHINNSLILNTILLKDVPNTYYGLDDLYVVSELKLRSSKQEKVILKFSDSKTIYIYKDNQNQIGKLLYVLKKE